MKNFISFLKSTHNVVLNQCVLNSSGGVTQVYVILLKCMYGTQVAASIVDTLIEPLSVVVHDVSFWA